MHAARRIAPKKPFRAANKISSVDSAALALSSMCTREVTSIIEQWSSFYVRLRTAFLLQLLSVALLYCIVRCWRPGLQRMLGVLPSLAIAAAVPLLFDAEREPVALMAVSVHPLICCIAVAHFAGAHACAS